MPENTVAAPAAPASIETQAPDSVETPQEAAPEAAAAPIEQKKLEQEIKKWKLRVDGQDQELTEAELLQHATLGKAAHKRMQEAAELKKNTEAFFELLKSDPIRVLSDPNIGVDVRAMAEAIINSELEDLKKSPEQREKDKLTKELEELKSQYKKDEESRKSSEFQRLQEQASVQLDTEITSALASSGLAKSPYTVKKMAEVMMIALQNNIELTAADCVPLIKKQMTDEIREMFSASPEDVIEEMLGKDNLNRLRKKSLQKIKQATPSTDVKATGNKDKPEAPKKIHFKDFFKPF